MDTFDKQHGAGKPTWIPRTMPALVEIREPLTQGGASAHHARSEEVADPVPAVGERTKSPPLGGRLKRIMDLTIAIAALFLAAPVMIVVASILWMSGGSALFSHGRVGFGGQRFSCYKFRSMVENAEEVLKAHLDADPDAALEWENTRKLRNDPRVSYFGRLLRRSSLDELPQLFNVIRGDMSCVGPRPIVTDELERYGDHVGEYLCTRPGITGLWQVSGRSSTGYDERVRLDRQYVQNWSPWLDLRILFRTVFAVLRYDQAA